MNQSNIIGIDTGSVTTAVVIIDSGGNVLEKGYHFHDGHPLEKVKEYLTNLPDYPVSGITFSTGTSMTFPDAFRFDERIALIRALRHLHPDAKSLLNVGGEKFGLIEFDERGNYLNYRSNSSCAAGTGSFLDQQATRLNLPGIEEFSHIAYENRDHIPDIASRCSVFAKTDIIHSQQEGYTRAQICDGLSRGLARNIVDTLLTGRELRFPVVFSGGVARNRAVVRHLEELMAAELIVDGLAPWYTALGCALLHMDRTEADESTLTPSQLADLLLTEAGEKSYHYPSLDLKLSRYPDFTSLQRYLYSSRLHPDIPAVEVDLYSENESPGLRLGVDIGSTSTKAVLLEHQGRVVAGFYTRTSGRPVEAFQVILEAIDDLIRRFSLSAEITGLSTTGSGRKLIGSIAGADLVIDEITAHARAAVEIDPEVDTIIEIGGQDSKFTTLKDGRVNFSVMNNVCAAGTGSFIEEQAKKLGCPLSEYADRTLKVSSPLASDRCTVFMERDLNHYFSHGYSVNEILASVLHAIRDNYLSRVATEKNIGKKVFFQGATAKNRALVAAFEQKLQRPIIVSKYCHLTGALGAALQLADEVSTGTRFRGIEMFREEIPLRSETCELCTNRCTIRIAEVGGETAAFGFLCGRDYQTERYVQQGLKHRLLPMRKRHFALKEKETGIRIGVPFGLHLASEYPFWRHFFRSIGLKVVEGSSARDALKRGKQDAGSEFCAPMTSFLGQVRYLEKNADFLFIPTVLMPASNNRERDLLRYYCYYTQYAPSIAHGIMEDPSRLLSPLLYHNDRNSQRTIDLLQGMMKRMGLVKDARSVRKAYEKAGQWFREKKRALIQKGEELLPEDDIAVALLGRPYTLLSDEMNNHIPDIFSRQGVMNIFQDMLNVDSLSHEAIEPLLRAIHWNYGEVILRAAHYVSRMEGLYPVLVTSFKCSPDSFIIDYFREILDGAGKPYLILQLDEHDSSVGYETRIEASIRAFRNHHREGSSSGNRSRYNFTRNILHYRKTGSDVLRDKTLLLPAWDHIACRLLAANLQGNGIDTRLLVDTPDSIQRSLSHNSGQCIPLNIIAQNCIDYVEREGLDPARTVIWSIDSRMACNIRMFPYYMHHLFTEYAKGMEKLSFYVGEVTFYDISIPTGMKAYYAYMIGGLLSKIACRLRPYEVIPGSTDRAIEESLLLLEEMFRTGSRRGPVLEKVSRILQSVRTEGSGRPRVAIFGDLYARDNDVMNSGLIRHIENHGGEVVTTPYSDYLKLIARLYNTQFRDDGYLIDWAIISTFYPVAKWMEKRLYRYFEPILKEPLMEEPRDQEDLFRRFNIKLAQNGESFDNIVKIFHLAERYPDLSFFVQTNPAFCCPSLVTEGMAKEIERQTGIPIVTITYDGTGGRQNDAVIPYLTFPRKGKHPSSARVPFSEKGDLTGGKAPRGDRQR